MPPEKSKHALDGKPGEDPKFGWQISYTRVIEDPKQKTSDDGVFTALAIDMTQQMAKYALEELSNHESEMAKNGKAMTIPGIRKELQTCLKAAEKALDLMRVGISEEDTPPDTECSSDHEHAAEQEEEGEDDDDDDGLMMFRMSLLGPRR